MAGRKVNTKLCGVCTMAMRYRYPGGDPENGPAVLTCINCDAKQAPKERVESFPEYLRRVGNDYADSGAEFTAQDYMKAAYELERLAEEVRQLKLDVASLERRLPKSFLR